VVFKLIKDIAWDVAFHCSAREMAVVCELLQKTESTYDILWELKGFVPARIGVEWYSFETGGHCFGRKQ